MKFLGLFLFCFFFTALLQAEEDCLSIFEANEECPDLMRDLAIIHAFDEEARRTLPVHQGFYGQTGYFAMPSARMTQDGDVIFGYSSVPPYSNYFLGFQLFKRIELTGVYRVFKGLPDPIMGQMGFGDFSDKGINIKFGLILPEDTDYLFPGVSFGWVDFLGSSRFDTKYVVATQVFPKAGVELSLGYRWGVSKGLFGGASWMPWWRSCDPVLKNFCFAAEYDPTDFSQDVHPDGRVSKSGINLGFKYLLGKYGNLFVSSSRGSHLALGAAFKYDIGSTCGVLPKIDDPLPYQSPINWQKLCVLRPAETFSQDIAFPLQEQGFCLMQSSLETCAQTGLKTLRLEVVNNKWRYERIVHMRLAHLMAFLTPEDIYRVIIVVRTEGLPIQQYRFRREDLWRYASCCMCDPELAILSPMKEVGCPLRRKKILFYKAESSLNYDLGPRFRSFFGSAKGKLKVGGDLVGAIDGFLWDFMYYRASLRYTVFSQMENLGDRDLLNPSQLINVNSDRIRYFQTANLFIEEAFLQRNWSLGCGFYARAAVGLFDVAYGGLGLEAIYYPVNSCWAIGLDGAIVKKRTYDGFNFMDKIRRYQGINATYVPYTVLSQYFLDFYYDFKPAEVLLKVSAGQFLAKDFGVRTELTRYFDNGLRVGIWYTYTNGNDQLNGSTYYDKGFMLSVPFDFFMTCSSKARWDYGMAAWLRDVGYRTWTGDPLFHRINCQRQ